MVFEPIYIILIAPLVTFLSLLLFGSYIRQAVAATYAVVNIFAALGCSLYCFVFYSFDVVTYAPVWRWLSVAGTSIDVAFRYDGLTAIRFIVVTLVSSRVHLYSTVYRYTDPFLTRFLSYLSLFSFFRLVLVSSQNFWRLFLGWEGVGCVSYLLIGFWYTRAQAGKAASKAFLINKVGDLFLLSGISVIFTAFAVLDFSILAVLVPFYHTQGLELRALLLFLGAVGKSAQIGLHSWLPDAREGPTPVSALLHAATMVTAGVFLLVRSSFLLEYTPRVLSLITVWGGLTALVSGTIGATQNDIKKIIAYSTCSQLGYRVLACGLSAYDASLFHLFNHAFFKAALFLSAGSVIHLMGNEQDIRKRGGLATLSPFVYVIRTVTSLALAGAPFLAGFYSKDYIIEAALTKFWSGGRTLYWLTIVSAALTAVYSFRLLEQTFWGDFNGFKIVIARHAKATNVELLVLGILGLLSLTTGYVFRDLFVGFGSNFFGSFITILPSGWSPIEAEFLGVLIKVLPLLLTFLATDLHSRFLECKWRFNEVVNGSLSLPALHASRHLFEQGEKLGIEENGVSLVVSAASRLRTARRLVA